MDPEPPLESSEEEGTTYSQLRKEFKKTKHRHKWLVTHLTFSNKLGVLYANFTAGNVRSGSDGSYRSELGLSSPVWRIESKCGMQYIQGGGMVPGKP